MSRAVDGTRRKDHRKKILKLAKGYWGRRHSNYKVAKDAVTKGLFYAYRDRRDRKGDFRRLWIIRINAACREEGLSYSRLVDGLTKAGVTIDRKALANLAIQDKAAFKAVVEKAKASLGA
ncbi:MAG TPA: 50S ribosomal protein L20 [Treponema sp.]|jgi:large subunit ribosomal protein L20|uniref:50S ribosomal protein L20 n=1 Tax=Gracilinema caldarium TaxID=215591 RepID=UPI001699D83D|nr:50S ribosomal protein L20 [Gracilinema caldarium]NLJ08804.1 50S ribosomal protein L20 [Treponema sp.]HON12518.1 50S ribosomal protein L20 [Treponema sp.]HPC71084.1 50S ribosomal protein L20 [Treponema sp.]HRS02951.1 50S ribosomal protein L20 [Treponema sp.]HRU27523.1 50S ribosomal protein L20 [Treponema sp.]